MKLIKRKCKPCEGGGPKLTPGEIEKYQSMLEEPWEAVDDMKIVKDLSFRDYASTISFVNKIAALAEEEGHHPVMHVFFSRIRVELWTHAILGLSENDFILAAKIDALK